MDGVHDMGGKQGFGPVRYETSKPVFKTTWEPRANALYSLGVRLGLVNMDEYRHAIERMEPRHYLAASYYERSLTGFATLCVEKGVVTSEELERLAEGAFPLSLPSAEGRLNAFPGETFKVGDRVRVKNESVSGHVRMPGYIRGKPGSWSASRRPIPTRTRPPTISRRRTSPPTTSASGPRICGRSPPTRRPSMSASSRATSKKLLSGYAR